jgi:hypothetical protein
MDLLEGNDHDVFLLSKELAIVNCDILHDFLLVEMPLSSIRWRG